VRGVAHFEARVQQQPAPRVARGRVVVDVQDQRFRFAHEISAASPMGAGGGAPRPACSNNPRSSSLPGPRASDSLETIPIALLSRARSSGVSDFEVATITGMWRVAGSE